VPAHKTEFAEVMTAFEGAGSEEVLRESLERFDFSLEENDGFYVWKRTDSEVGRRYVGGAAVSYLRSRQGDFVDFLSAMKNGGGDAFRDGAREYFAFVNKKKGADE
jgi:hypothetical protein